MTRDILLVGIALLTWGIGEGMFINFQTLYLQKLGANPVEIGVILGAAAVLMAFAHIPAGYLADRLGNRLLLWLAWPLGMVATWIMALSPGLYGFVAGLLLYGVTAFVSAPMNSYITSTHSKWPPGKIITTVGAIYNVGMVLGPVIGGKMADSTGLKGVFFVAGVIFILSTGIIFFLGYQPSAHSRMQETSRTFLWHNRPFMQFLGLIFLTQFVIVLPQPFTPNHLQQAHNLSMSSIGLLFALANLGAVLLMLGLGRLNSRVGYLLGVVAMGLFTFLLWKGTGVFWYGIGYFFAGSSRVCHSLASALAKPLVKIREVGLAFGMGETAMALGMILSPVLAGALFSIHQDWVFSVSLVLIVSILLVDIRFLPRDHVVPEASPKVAETETGEAGS